LGRADVGGPFGTKRERNISSIAEILVVTRSPLTLMQAKIAATASS